MASSSLCPACGEGKEQASDSLCQGCVEAAAAMVTQDDDEEEEPSVIVVVTRRLCTICRGTLMDLSSTQGICHACVDAASGDVTPIKLNTSKAGATSTPESVQRRLALHDGEEDRVTMLTVKSPGKLIQEKFMAACENGQVIELLLSQESPSSPECTIVDVKTNEDRISQRVEQAAAAGRIETILSSPSFTPKCLEKKSHSSKLKSNTNNTPSDTNTCIFDVNGSPQAATTSRLDDAGSTLSTPSNTSKKDRGGGCGEKLCATCDAPLPEVWMDWCKRCYAVRGSSEITSPSKGGSSGPGKCRLCTGATGQDWKEYCLKCYKAKQRDDAQRKRTITAPATAAAVANKPFEPYTCVKCGGHCNECWMQRCGACYNKSPSASKRPKLK